MCFRKVRSVELLLQTKFSTLFRRNLVIAESGIFSLRKAGFGHGKVLEEGFEEKLLSRRFSPIVISRYQPRR